MPRFPRPKSKLRYSTFTGGYTGEYTAYSAPQGPLYNASKPLPTPRQLKEHLDRYVVGQERAKKVLCTAVYQHQRRIQELQRREDEADEYSRIGEWDPRQTSPSHPQRSGEEHSQSSREWALHSYLHSSLGNTSPEPTLQKSNILLLGPSGTGKTLLASTLSTLLSIPLSISDCNTFTQAGYVGDDVEVCVSRLLSSANYNTALAERGIICLDEIDKLARRGGSSGGPPGGSPGRDVSGEGVQQALLKLIEGTDVEVTVRSRPGGTGGAGAAHSAFNQGRGETYKLNTENILFICAGAFTGLERIISSRTGKQKIGFSNPTESNDSPKDHPKDPPKNSQRNDSSKSPTPFPSKASSLPTPQDLIEYGLIPELISRLPLLTPLEKLGVSDLIRILTEPHNSLIGQYIHLFALDGVELRITREAMYNIAVQAEKLGTGARGLRGILEGLLSDAMFSVPGSGIGYVLVREGGRVEVFPHGDGGRFRALYAVEEERWAGRGG
ncbi:ClpX, ATPase regulatory subunit [Piedraia hortae CBS 480.64]|uniref:ClpX, ATPase regulatory subunit n=1 Tax=Piedraia hortae CBS 480.64 TaxID=1314780 RepID=A0A6A7C1G2_9PEZI|nr:ClpX, ATPase regulatory subunit [Piedraia hortae CBS 480.64]